MGPAASQSLRWQISGGLLNLNLTPRPLSNSSAINSSSHPVCPGCLLPNNDASRKTEIEPLVQTSSRVVFSLCPGSLSFAAPSLLVSQSITASGLRQQCVGSLDFKHRRRVGDKVEKAERRKRRRKRRRRSERRQ